MRYYAVSQWLIFFFIYCFLGWIWECCYVSVRKHKWVNRGFLHGPFLPIYGSGAIVILISTIAVKDIVPLVFLLGMVSSTILEFCTGCCMEKLFGVRYWDYSNLPLNFKGHICFFISLAWGAFSILLVCVIHKPIEAAVLMIPRTIADIIAVVLAIYMAADFAVSINEAMDLKATLEKFTKENETEADGMVKSILLKSTANLADKVDNISRFVMSCLGSYIQFPEIKQRVYRCK